MKNNLKKSVDLMARRLYTEKYLKQYDLQTIDCSLSEMFPDPIGLHNKRRWYTVAARMLLNAFTGIDLEINLRSDRLYFEDENGDRRIIDNFSVSSFAEFLEIVLHTSDIFNCQLDWSERDLKKFLTNLLEDKRFVTYKVDDHE